MIAKYDGKCGLTGTQIIAGETEIAKFGKVTVLAEYATQEAVDGWFAEQAATFAGLCNEISQATGREYNALERFNETLSRRRNDRFVTLQIVAEWVRSEIAQQQRILESKRQSA